MINSPIYTTPLKADEISCETAIKYIRRHIQNDVPRLKRLDDYYSGVHAILSREKAADLCNNRVMINHSKYISDFASAYLVGEPVTYSSQTDISALTDMLKKADSATQDSDLALDASVFGRAYDMFYMSADEVPLPKLARLSPLCAFVVYDETVEQNPVFAVYYYPVYSDTGCIERFECSFCTDRFYVDFSVTDSFSLISREEPREHRFGVVPINEIYNNGRRQGDFEQVISLIDAYNTLQSDRVNDKQQFVDALFYIKGQVLGDTDPEKADTWQSVKENRVLELSSDGEAGFLSRQFDEASVETLKQSIGNDIHKISGVPDMSDEKFAGNSSGVAMKYKLLALEQMTRTKERFFAEGLRYRLTAFANVAAIKGKTAVDVGDVDIKFTRSLPVNELEAAQTAATLNGIAPRRAILSTLPCVSDVDAAIAELDNEAEESRRARAQMFANTPIADYNENDE